MFLTCDWINVRKCLRKNCVSFVRGISREETKNSGTNLGSSTIKELLKEPEIDIIILLI